MTPAIREEGICGALVALKDDTRRALDEMAAVDKLRESVAGHLRNAPNMMGIRNAEICYVNADRDDIIIIVL